MLLDILCIMFLRSCHKDYVVLLSLIALSSPSYAATVKLKSCLFSVGGVCPVETLGLGIVGIVVLALAGWPLRWLIERHVKSISQVDPTYNPGYVIKFVHRNAGKLSLLCAIWLLITFIS